jgi:flagellar protein FlbT
LMYLDPDPKAHHLTYFSLLKDMLTVEPSSWSIIEGINNFILEGDLYKALKEAKKLIAHEKELLEAAAREQVRKSA